MRARLKGINKATPKLADGTRATYYYHRATGTRLTGEPGTPEFLADSFTPNLMLRSEKQDRAYRNLDDDPRGPWKTTILQLGTSTASGAIRSRHLRDE
jgi:hypothetical protein